MISRLPATARESELSPRADRIAVFCRSVGWGARETPLLVPGACRARPPAFVVLVRGGMMMERRADTRCEKELAGR